MYGSPAATQRYVSLMPPASYGTGITEGTGTSEHQGFYTAKVVLALGVLGTAATVDVIIEENDALADGPTWAAVPGAVFSQKVKATDDGKVYLGELTLPRRKKFLRAVGTGGAAASIYHVGLDLSNPRDTRYVDGPQIASEAKAGAIGTSQGGGAGWDFRVV